MNKYIMSFDQGTTSSRCVIYDKEGKTVSVAQQEFEQIYPNDGWVEHDPKTIWETQLKVAKDTLKNAGITAGDIDAIGITNQRETTVLWDRETGEPVYNAIVWQCRRTAAYCDELKEKGLEKTIKAKTGLKIDPYFSGTKIRWILDNVNGVRRKAEEGRILFGTIESWLIWKLTGGRVHISDYSNASRTMLFNIHSLEWDKEILEILDIPASILPEAVECSRVYGYTDPELFGAEIPISGACGDQQAALFGQGCIDPGKGKMTYGTGGFMLLNTGFDAFSSDNGLLTTIAWGLNGKVKYALEGSVFVAGAAIQWLRDEMDLIETSPDSEIHAERAGGSGGVYVVPAFTGLGAPYWDPYARGIICGITRGTTKDEIIRATLESLAFQTYDLAKSMEEDFGRSLDTFRVDGGACSNDLLMQFQADILQVEVVRPIITEATSLGAAFLAGLASGYWKNEEEIQNIIKIEKVFYPAMPAENRDRLLEGWHKAVSRSLSWSE